MRRCLQYTMLVLCLVASQAAWAQRASRLTQACNSDSSEIEVRFEAGSTALGQLASGYATLSIEGLPCLAPAAVLPALPTANRLIAVPRGTQLRIASVHASVADTMLCPAPLAPYHPNIKDGSSSQTHTDKEAYSANAWQRGGARAELSRIGTLGQQDIYRLTLRPAAYNAALGLAAVEQQITLSISVGLAPNSTGIGSALAPNSIQPEATEARRYLIVAPPQFRASLQPFAQWKREEGYHVEQLFTTTTNADSLRAAIGNQWGADGFAYILLVGDAALLPPFVGTTRPQGLPSHATDLFFAEHTGDYLPDACVGRWPASDTAAVGIIARKTIAYERGQGLDTAALRRIMLVAGRELATPAPTTTNGQVNYLRERIAATLPNVDTVCFHNPSSDTLLPAIQASFAAGATLLNYTGHCDALGWTRPRTSAATFDSLGTAMPTLWVNNCCLSNNFLTDCFGTRLLLAATGGAVAAIGATNSTLWDEDYYWAVGPKYPAALMPIYDPLHLGAFDHLLQAPVGSLSAGHLLQAGCLAVTAFGSPHDRFYWETYCLLGDPSLHPFLGLPDTAQLALASPLDATSASVLIATSPGAIVSATADSTLLGCARADSTGHALLTLSRTAGTQPLTLTATAPQMVARQLTTCATVPQHGLGISTTALTDSNIALIITNIGTDTLHGAVLQLACDTAYTSGTHIAAAQAAIDVLIPGADTALALPYSITSLGPQPWWQATLTAADTATLCTLPLRHRLGIEYPQISIDILSPDGSPLPYLSIDAPYNVQLGTTQPCDSLERTLSVLHDSLPQLLIEATASLGRWHTSAQWYVPFEPLADGFERGLGSYPWQLGGTQPWLLDSTCLHSGRYSLRSGAIGHNQTSDISLHLLLPHADSVSFYALTSTERNADRLLFSIDGATLVDRSGGGSWQRYAFAVGEGEHTLRWRYSKDASLSNGSDAAWIDDIGLPLSLWSAPCGYPIAAADTAMPADSTHAAIASPPSTASIGLLPNPAADGRTTIRTSFAMASVVVADLYGRPCATLHAAGAQSLSLNTTVLPSGLYIITIRSTDGTNYHRRLLVANP